MFKIDTNNINNKTSIQREKENYIANMLVNTLYSNNINNAECYRIIKLFEKKVLGDEILNNSIQ